MNGASKICKNCGRSFDWRKKWEKIWPEVKYCSKACQHQYSETEHLKITNCILEMTRTQNSICPSDVARALYTEEKLWRSKMETVRRVARLLCYKKLINITQKNKPVNPNDFKGPIRLKAKQ